MKLEDKILKALAKIKQGNPLQIYAAIYQDGGGNFDSLSQKLGSMAKERRIKRIERGIYAINK